MASRPSGRRVKEPIADLIEVVGDGAARTLIVFHADYRHAPALQGGSTAIRGFQEAPHVPGIAALIPMEGAGVFAYETGPIRTVRELIGVFASEGGAGWRAALELLERAGRALIDAAAAGAGIGLDHHGALSPWRLAVKPDGSVLVIGPHRMWWPGCRTPIRTPYRRSIRFDTALRSA